MNISELKVDESALVAKAKADLAAGKAEEAKAKSWLEANWHYALAIAVGGLFLGLALGYRFGLHAHV